MKPEIDDKVFGSAANAKAAVNAKTADSRAADDVYVRAAQAAYETYVKAICAANVVRVAHAQEVWEALAIKAADDVYDYAANAVRLARAREFQEAYAKEKEQGQIIIV